MAGDCSYPEAGVEVMQSSLSAFFQWLRRQKYSGMLDFVVYNLGFMLGASKRLDHKQSCREQCTSLLRFIHQYRLSKEPLEWVGTYPPDDLILRASQLTDEGAAVMRQGLRRWTSAHDRGLPKDDWTILEQALEVVRNQ